MRIIDQGITYYPAEQEIPEYQEKELHSLAAHEAGHYIMAKTLGVVPTALNVVSEPDGGCGYVSLGMGGGKCFNEKGYD